jgi:hypothetical protein
LMGLGRVGLQAGDGARLAAALHRAAGRSTAPAQGLAVLLADHRRPIGISNSSGSGPCCGRISERRSTRRNRITVSDTPPRSAGACGFRTPGFAASAARLLRARGFLPDGKPHRRRAVRIYAGPDLGVSSVWWSRPTSSPPVGHIAGQAGHRPAGRPAAPDDQVRLRLHATRPPRGGMT